MLNCCIFDDAIRLKHSLFKIAYLHLLLWMQRSVFTKPHQAPHLSSVLECHHGISLISRALEAIKALIITRVGSRRRIQFC